MSEEEKEEKARVALHEKKKEDHESNGYWYTWVFQASDGGGPIWECVPISEHEEKEAEEKKLTRQPPVGKEEGVSNERDCPPASPPVEKEDWGFWTPMGYLEGFSYETCDDWYSL